MKITIPSRIAAPTAPPDAQHTAPSASTSTAQRGDADGTAAPAMGGSGPSTSTTRIRIKQSGASTSSANVPAAADASVASSPVKLEEGTYVNAQGAGSPSNDNSASTSSLILPGKRKRTSLTPSSNNNNDSGKLHQHQTRHSANPEEIDKAYTDGMKLWQALRDLQKKDGKLMSQEFLHLPPRDAFPDYYQMIRKPISLSEIRNKIERREYGTNPVPTAPSGILKLISEDIKQLFFNAKRYNQKGSVIYNDARKLDRLHRHTYERLAGISKEADPNLDAEGRSEDEQGDMRGGRKNGSTPVPQSGSTTPAVGGQGQQPAKKKYKKSNQQPEEKPITLTKWLSMKVDDLVAMTDKSGRVLSEVFMQVPPQSQYPDYYQIIQKPISFQLVRSRLKNRNYQTIEKFKDDVNLIFTNAQLYNEDGSQIWQDAQQMKKYFNTIMQEEPPEFFVRPRNQSQQATANRPGEYDTDQSKHRYASSLPIQGNSYPGFEPRAGSSFVAPPAQNAYDTVKFGEFDEHDASMDQEPDIAVEPQGHQNAGDESGMILDGKSSSPAKGELASQSLQPLPQQLPPQQQAYGQPYLQQSQTPSIAVPTQSLSGVVAKEVSKLVDPAYPPIIKSFTVSLYSATSNTRIMQHYLANALVRQHTITLSKDVSRVEITPFLSCSPMDFHPYAHIVQRHMTLSDAATTPTVEEQQAGAAARKWQFSPAPPGSLASLEIKAAEEIYRIFVMSLAT